MNENTNPPAEPAYSAPVAPQEDAPAIEHEHGEDVYDEAGVSDDLEGDFDADETNEEDL